MKGIIAALGLLLFSVGTTFAQNGSHRSTAMPSSCSGFHAGCMQFRGSKGFCDSAMSKCLSTGKWTIPTTGREFSNVQRQ